MAEPEIAEDRLVVLNRRMARCEQEMNLLGVALSVFKAQVSGEMRVGKDHTWRWEMEDGEVISGTWTLDEQISKGE